MARRASAEASVAALCAAHDHAGEPEVLVRRLANQHREAMGETPPVDLEVVASSVGAHVEWRTTAEAGSVRWEGNRYVITVSDRDILVRQRFTLAHEIIHTFFMEATGNRAAHVDSDTATFDSNALEEYLCDVGASELILPTSAVVEMLPSLPTMDDVLAIAETCEASIEAAARRVVQLTDMPGAVIVLEPKLKPVERRSVSSRRTSPALPGLEPDLPVPKLRVRYGASEGLDFIPRDKSVDDACPLAAVPPDETIDFVGYTGLLKRELAVSARLLPVVINGESIDRVVAIAFDAHAWRNHEAYVPS